MEDAAANGADLRLGRVIAQCADLLRRGWRDLLIVGLIVFVPIGLLSSIGPADGIEIDRLDDLRVVPLLLLAIVQIVVPLIGTVFYAGAVSSRIVRERGGEQHGLRELARQLPYGRLIAADLLLVLLTGIGLALLIVPGVIILARYALVAPVIEVEGITVRAAFARSRELVRGHFWIVAGLVWPITLLGAALESLGEELSFDLLGEGFFGDWLTSVLGELLTAPIWAVIVVVLYLELREHERPTAAA